MGNINNWFKYNEKLASCKLKFNTSFYFIIFNKIIKLSQNYHAVH